MHLFPSERRPARRRPRHRLARGLVSALVATGAAAGATGCASRAGLHDGGAAPSLAAPTSASPLWPDLTTPSPPEADQLTPSFARYLPVEKVRVPAGGVAALSAKTLLEADPNVPAVVQSSIGMCPDAECPMRAPVPRDLTGDRRDELVVAVDLPKFDRTLLQVYWASGRTVRPILIYWGPLGLTGDTYGRDLLLTSTGRDGRFTTRFRWNGEVMAAVTPEGDTEAQDPAPAETTDTDTPPADSDTRTTR